MWLHGGRVVPMIATYSGYQQYVDGWKGNVVLGDSGYACTPFLMTPYPQPCTRSEEQFNRAHKTTRCIIERSFGLLKRRFHVLHSEIRMAPDRVCTIIVACIVLHNMAIHLREPRWMMVLLVTRSMTCTKNIEALTMEMQSEGTSQTLSFEGTLYLWGYIDVKFTGCGQSF